MTGAQFSALVARTGWSARFVGRRVGLSHGMLNDMQTGRRTPHPQVVDYLTRVAAAIERVPVPKLIDRRWRD